MNGHRGHNTKRWQNEQQRSRGHLGPNLDLAVSTKRPRLEKGRNETTKQDSVKVKHVTGVYRSDYAIFPRPRDLHTELQRGTFDILIISKTHGLVICEIKAIGDFFGVPSANMTKNDEKNVVRKRLAKALTQLEKEKKVLQYLISDIGEFRSDKVPIMKTLILPNLKRETLEDVLRDDKELTKKFRECLDAETMEDALNRCLFSRNFPPVGKAWEVDEVMISSLEQWWRAITGKTGKPQMDDEAYDSLAARFCGPATSLHVQTAHQSRADVRTLPGAVIETARCLDAPTLYPEQIQDKLASKAVSTDEAKLAAAKQVKLLSHKEGLKTLLEELQTSSHQATSEKGATPNGVQHPFVHKNEKKSLHLVIDEAPWFFGQVFQLLRSQASKRVELYIWAASVYYGSRPNSFEEMRLVRPLRCPPAVLRELETGPAYSTRAMYPYATMDTGILSSVPPPTDGPPVKRIIHAGPGHTAGKCDSTLRPQRTLQYSDVIVSGYIRLAQEKPQPTANRKDADDDPMQSGTTSDHEEAMDTNTTPASFAGFLEGLEVEKVPFDVITTMDQTVAEELASPKNNVVQVAAPDSIIGLERPVVVLIGTNDMNATVPQYVDPWCDVIARCLSQLVIVSGPASAVEDWVGMANLKLH
ncbi:hypothetical protein BaRGS_00011669 [Batillaria attramentaria]|uniref:Uncharacterized protein n=1 Tax=Batillaria attramentaria TaxID=370345 RepID=A0ABD0LDQ8_9CAEN